MDFTYTPDHTLPTSWPLHACIYIEIHTCTCTCSCTCHAHMRYLFRFSSCIAARTAFPLSSSGVEKSSESSGSYCISYKVCKWFVCACTHVCTCSTNVKWKYLYMTVTRFQKRTRKFSNYVTDLQWTQFWKLKTSTLVNNPLTEINRTETQLHACMQISDNIIVANHRGQKPQNTLTRVS